VKRLQTREAEEGRYVREADSVEATRPHARKIHVTSLPLEREVARPKKRIGVQIDDERLAMDPKRLVTDLDGRRRPKRRLRVPQKERANDDED